MTGANFFPRRSANPTACGRVRPPIKSAVRHRDEPRTLLSERQHMGFAQTVDASGKPVHKPGKGSHHQIGLVRGQFGGVPEAKWLKFVADTGFDGWEEASWELDLRRCDTDEGAASYAKERVPLAKSHGLGTFTVAPPLQGQVRGDEPSAKTLNSCSGKGEARAAYKAWRAAGNNPPRT